LAQHSAPTSPDQASDLVVAGTGRRLLGVRFARPGPATLRLHYRSPYNNDPPVDEYVLHALVEARHVGFSVDQLATAEDEPWAAPARQRQLERLPDPLDDPEQLADLTDDDQD